MFSSFTNLGDASVGGEGRPKLLLVEQNAVRHVAEEQLNQDKVLLHGLDKAPGAGGRGLAKSLNRNKTTEMTRNDKMTNVKHKT